MGAGPTPEGGLAILVMAYGTPSSLEDVERYLTHIREGMRPTREEVERLRARYEAIGGSSPLTRITRAQAQALEEELRLRGHDVKAFMGMLHSHPYIEEAMASIRAQGFRWIVALPLTPHYSRLSTGKYEKRVWDVVAAWNPPPRLTWVRGWHRHPLFVDAWVEKVRPRLEALRATGEGRPMVVFTAHSLPLHILDWGDPYPGQVRETCELIAARLGLTDWSFAYQSVGMRGGRWLGPEVQEELLRLMGEGYREFLLVPVGFVADHLEVLYDIDVELRSFAAERGARVERVEMLNTSPNFVRALASLVEEAIGAQGAEGE